MQTNPPKSVVIGGKRIRIRVIPDMDNWGEYHHDKAEIHIAARALQKRSDFRATLRHEVMHAALAISGVSYCTGFQEEAVVRCMEDIFFPAWLKIHAKLNTP